VVLDALEINNEVLSLMRTLVSTWMAKKSKFMFLGGEMPDQVLENAF